MKKNHLFILFVFASMIMHAQNNWTQKPFYGGDKRNFASGFSIGSKGYILVGGSDTSVTKNLWEYDTLTSVWTRKADFPGTARETAVGFSIGNKGYLGTGKDWSGNFFKDFWQYNPATNTWTQKADFGGTGRYSAVGFSIGGKGYIGTGNDGNNQNDFWEYDTLSNTWAMKAFFTGIERYGAVGFSIGNKGYIGGGSGNAKDFYEYNPANNTWTKKADLLVAGVLYASAFSFGTTAYVATDNTGIGSDLMEYDQATDKWILVANLTQARFGAVGFSIGNKGYLGTGQDGSGRRKDFWEYTPCATFPTATITAGGPTTFCQGDSVTLTANTGTGYTWTNNKTTQSITVKSSGSYSVIVASPCGTVTSSPISVTVNSYPTPVITGTTTICKTTNTTMTTNGGGTYIWNTGSTTATITVSPTVNTSYSVTVTSSGCSGTASTYVTVNNDCVWPGDTDHDNLVNNNDLLPLGLHYSQTGSPRTSISDNWQAYLSTNWGTFQANGEDVKHVDCNGDGTIDNNDTLAINQNFSLTHAIIPTVSNQERQALSDLYLVINNNTYNAGDFVDVEVWLGTSAAPVNNLYGIAFDIDYNASFVQTGTANIIYSNSWLGTPGTNAIKISKIDPAANIAYGAQTRIDHTNASGYGKIADFKFQLKNPLPADTQMIFSVLGYKSNNAAGVSVLFNTLNDSITINSTASGITEISNNLNVTVFPNPFVSQTIISFNKEIKNGTLKIVDVVGKEVLNVNFSGTQQLIEKGELKAGIYFMQVISKSEIIITKKIIIQ